jgi:hypothetical protein
MAIEGDEMNPYRLVSRNPPGVRLHGHDPGEEAEPDETEAPSFDEQVTRFEVEGHNDDSAPDDLMAWPR